MKKDKITEKEAIEKLKALGLTENEAVGTIEMRLKALNATRERQAIDAIIDQIEEKEEK